MKDGFTLIELLVVVLIIGILSAIAVPKYTKAVQRTKAVQLKKLVKNFSDSQARYYQQNSVYARSFGSLDISLENFEIPSSQIFNYTIGLDAIRRSKDFELLINSTLNPTEGFNGIVGVTISGPFKGGGVSYYFTDNRGMPTGQLICSEATAAITIAGSYCEDMLGYKYHTSAYALRLYIEN